MSPAVHPALYQSRLRLSNGPAKIRLQPSKRSRHICARSCLYAASPSTGMIRRSVCWKLASPEATVGYLMCYMRPGAWAAFWMGGQSISIMIYGYRLLKTAALILRSMPIASAVVTSCCPGILLTPALQKSFCGEKMKNPSRLKLHPIADMAAMVAALPVSRGYAAYENVGGV